MKPYLAVWLLALGAIAALAYSGRLPAAAQSQDKSKKPDASAPAGQFVEEKGKLRILLDGRQVGTEEFQIAPEGGAGKDWLARGETEVRLSDGGSVKVSGQLKFSADGTPLHYEWSSRGQKKASAVVEFHGGTARVALQLEGAQPYIQELTFGSSAEPGRGTPRVVILDNNIYHHYAVLARLYNWNTRGPQTFPVLIPQDMTPGAITLESLGLQDVNGLKLEVLRIQSADLEIHLYVDSSHRLLRIEVPASKAIILRE